MLLLLTVALCAAAGVASAPEGLLVGSTAAVTTVKLVHLLCFATSWGATVWAIFIGGVIMFLNLPRHMMGSLRGKVFPACLALTAACTAVSSATFAWLHRPWQAMPAVERRQLGVLVAAAGLDLANLLLFAPKVLKVIRERHKLERGLGVGDLGSFDGMRSNARAAGCCAALAAANGRFRIAHALSALATLTSAAGLAAHSCYLAGKLAP
ncbi:uncharacterized protein LOC133904583 [Phragmites australis]|uniref:uncharacterized protein LOC133904583 n=1 Tax=Phragmites australis TaxID=29695 RepID=UPI002D799072|nr:uncharacterized protein LOC133904583 [Phragmites australis]